MIVGKYEIIPHEEATTITTCRTENYYDTLEAMVVLGHCFELAFPVCRERSVLVRKNLRANVSK